MISLEQHKEIQALSIKAGQTALIMRQMGQLNARQKTEESYSTVTDADIEASNILVSGLSNLFPNFEVISEEDETHHEFGQYRDAILIDPIDGTGQFSRGHERFSVLVSLIKDGEPVYGLAYYPDPRISKIYFTSPVNNHSYEQDVKVHGNGSFSLERFKQLQIRQNSSELRVSEVYSDAGTMLDDLDFRVVKGNSPSAYIDMLGNQTDLVTGPHTMMDWDIAAFDAIARKAGALFIDANTRNPLKYGEARSQDRAFMIPQYIAGSEELLMSSNLLDITSVPVRGTPTKGLKNEL